MSETLHTPLSSVEDDYRNSVEGNLHEFLDELCTIAIQSRNSVSSKWESYLKYVKGNQWPSNLPDYKSDFTLNLVEANIKRKAAYLTDTKPIIDIIPRDISLQPVAEILQLLVRGIWDERAVLAALTRCLYMAQIFGSGPMNLIWDEDLDFGNGEVNFIPLDPRHFLMDPGIVTAEDLQQAEYIILEGVYPINLLKFLYPKEAPYIKADPKYSKYSTYASTAEESLLAPSGKSQRRPLKTGNVNLNDSSIPRAIVQEFWIKDRVLFKDLPEKTQKSINAQLESKGLLPKSPEDRVWPGGRHIIRAGGKILRDESNPYFDLQFPCELFSWGMAIEHPWGKSEVEEIMGINTVINKIGASMIENTLLMNNSVWIGDSNALLPEQWEKLTNKPGLTVKKRPGSQLERTPAPALPGSTFALQQWLTQQLQDISGMVDVLQGKAGNQTTGVAIEALQCVDIETECLTNRGWKKHGEINQDDLLYSIDPTNGKAVWSKILNLHSYHHNGELYYLQSKNIDSLVTHNHAWYVTDESRVHRDKELPYRRIETQDLLPSHLLPCSFSPIDNEYNLYTDSLVELIGWIVTEGNYYFENQKKGTLRGSPCIRIGQSLKKNPEKCRMIEGVLNAEKIHYTTYTNKNGVIVYHIRGNPARYLMELLPTKLPTHSFLHSLSLHQLKILHNTMILGDGHISKRDGKVVYYTSDRELADIFQYLSILCGYSSTTLKMKNNGEGKKHKSPRYNHSWSISVKKCEHIAVKNIKINKVPYSGLVWCPTTSTGTWLARRNGKTFFTGNSQGQALLRLQARSMEVFLERLGQKLISRIIQFYSSEKIINILGPNPKLLSFEFHRDDILSKIKGIDPRTAFQDFVFKIEPLSSLTMSKMQKLISMSNLYSMGLVPGSEVLKAAQIQDPEGTLEKARVEQAAKLQPQGSPIKSEPPQGPSEGKMPGPGGSNV